MHWKKLPREVREALGQALLVHVELLARAARRSPWPSRSPRAGRAARSRARCSRTRGSARSRARGSAKRGQLRRDLADHLHAAARRARARATSDGHRDHDEQELGQAARQPSRRFSAAQREHERDRAEADRGGRARGCRRPRSACARSAPGSGRGRRPPPACPSRFFTWSSTSSAAGAEREADDHRVRDVAGQVAEPEQRDRRAGSRRP